MSPITDARHALLSVIHSKHIAGSSDDGMDVNEDVPYCDESFNARSPLKPKGRTIYSARGSPQQLSKRDQASDDDYFSQQFRRPRSDGPRNTTVFQAPVGSITPGTPSDSSKTSSPSQFNKIQDTSVVSMIPAPAHAHSVDWLQNRELDSIFELYINLDQCGPSDEML